MSLGRFRLSLGLLVVGMFFEISCATKVVELATSPDGGADGGGDPQDGKIPNDAGPVKAFPVPFCINFTDANGNACVSCYDEFGALLRSVCTPPTPVMKCQAVGDPLTATRCLECVDVSGVKSVPACLKCESPVGGCSLCVWSDAPATQCKWCMLSDGTVASQSCDGQQSELL